MYTVFQKPQAHLLYCSPSEQRYQNIINIFRSQYQEQPEFISRAPGRLHIIGGHIDFAGFSVIAAAIEKDCLIAVNSNKSDKINVSHVSSNIFPSQQLSINPNQQIDLSLIKNNYIKYFHAGYQAGCLSVKSPQLKGMNILIEGNISQGIGLSSSAALCVSSALAAVRANQTFEINKLQLVDNVTTAQRKIGSGCGGMDHSASFLGQLNTCLHIQFNPLISKKVIIPTKCKFIVINSLVQIHKLGSAAYRSNKRVCESIIAMHIIAKNLNLPQEIRKRLNNLKQLQQNIKVPIKMMPKLISQYLKKQPYFVKDIEDILGQNLQEIIKGISKWQLVYECNQFYNIFGTAMHIYQQAERVQNFLEICRCEIEDKKKLPLLGQLMNQSQKSDQQLLNCSCPEIDELVCLTLKYGAYGTRIMGAGWGGCIVSLVDSDKSQEFIKNILQNYYYQQKNREKTDKLGQNNVIFETRLAQGACIINL